MEIPTLGEFGQSPQSVAASLIVAFNPYTPGSPACPGVCDLPEGWSTYESVDALDPRIVTDPECLQYLLPENGGLDPTEPLEGLYGG